MIKWWLLFRVECLKVQAVALFDDPLMDRAVNLHHVLSLSALPHPSATERAQHHVTPDMVPRPGRGHPVPHEKLWFQILV